jgi:hypothetical protein
LPCVLFETLSCILLLQYLFSEVLLTFLLSLVTKKNIFVHFLGWYEFAGFFQKLLCCLSIKNVNNKLVFPTWLTFYGWF